MALSRRSLFQASGAAALGAVGLGAVPALADTEVRTRVLIVGSGPGGSIAADRLTAAGVDCTVLERGRRWNLGEFPPALAPDSRSFWLDELSAPSSTLEQLGGGNLPLPGTLMTGLLDVVVTPTVEVMCGAGVGGSNLVYAAMLPQPTRDAIAALLPTVDYDELDRVYYPRVRAGIGGGTAPDDVIANPRYRRHRVFRDAAEKAGVRVEKLFCGIDWNIVRNELTDEGSVTGASTGDYMLTSPNSGAKLTVDRSYLARAERTGRCRVLPLHEMTEIVATPDGRYTVTADQRDVTGLRVKRVRFVADAVVLAAGAMHTPGLLVRARDTGGLPRLNDQVGRGWGTNGDQNAQVMRTPLDGGSGGPSPLAAYDDTPARAMIEPQPELLIHDAPVTFDFSMARTTGNGVWNLDATGRPQLSWSFTDDLPARLAVERLSARIHAGSGAVGAYLPPPAITVHPLGGAVLGKATDGYGRLDGYRNLYCLDGSLLPGSTGGVNPTLTIGAIVERCLDEIIPRDFAG